MEATHRVVHQKERCHMTLPLIYRSYTLSLRLTPVEHELLDKAATEMSYSAYARECLFGQNAIKRRTRNKHPVKDHQELSRLLAWVGSSRIANNLNQLAYAANCGALILEPEQADTLTLACHDLKEIKAMLMKALGLTG